MTRLVLVRPLGLFVDTGVPAEQLVQKQREGINALGRYFYIHDGSCWLLKAVWPASGSRHRNRADTLRVLLNGWAEIKPPGTREEIDEIQREVGSMTESMLMDRTTSSQCRGRRRKFFYCNWLEGITCTARRHKAGQPGCISSAFLGEELLVGGRILKNIFLFTLQLCSAEFQISMIGEKMWMKGSLGNDGDLAEAQPELSSHLDKEDKMQLYPLLACRPIQHNRMVAVHLENKRL